MQRKRRRIPIPYQRGLLYELGRGFFPELVHNPRALRIRMAVITVATAALLVGMLVGFYHRANIPPEVLQIQAREAQR